ncbi:hypothetical protein B0H34DRAFT_668196, partial [Crassisporium funariophilum]
LNACLCGDVAQPSNEEEAAVRCKQPGCKTEWYHLACINLELAPRNWVCAACKVACANNDTLPYIVMCLIT